MLDQSLNKLEQILSSSTLSILRSLLCLGVGFLLGISVYLPNYKAENFCESDCDSSLESIHLLPSKKYSEQLKIKHVVERSDPSEEIMLLSRNEYACNTLGAFDELTALHQRSAELDKRKVKGEANRARTATMERKITSAHVAESTFRMCVQKLIPELLDVWDGQMQRNELPIQHTKKGHKEEDGIDLGDLENMANALEGLR